MKNLLLFTMALFPAILLGQTKMVEKGDPRTGLREKYYVLKADKKTRDGEYSKRAFYFNYLYETGFYKNNLKDSSWQFYSGDKPEVTLAGNYKNDQRVGVWNVYTRGQVQISYDYTTNKLLFYKPTLTDSTRLYRVLNGMDTTMMQLSRPPVYLDGINRFMVAVARNIRYPGEARDARQTGTVHVTFTINPDGTLSDHHVEVPVKYGLTEEALKAVKKVEGKWLPGMLNGKPVKMLYEVPVTFNLMQDIVIH